MVEVGDLVEEEGVAVSQLDQAWAAGGRAGEGAALVAEQLGARELGVGAELAEDDDGPGALAEALVRAARVRACAGPWSVSTPSPPGLRDKGGRPGVLGTTGRSEKREFVK